MDKKTKNDLMDIAAELVVSPLTAYATGRELYKKFKASEANAKIVSYAEQKGEEIQRTAKKISVNFNEKASQFAENISDKAMDFSKKAGELSKKAEEKFIDFDERKETMIYQFADTAEDKIKEFSENVKTTAKDFGETVTQKFNGLKKEEPGEVVSVMKTELEEEPVVCEEPVVLQNNVEEDKEPSSDTEESMNVIEESIAPQANTIFENKSEE